MPIKNSVHIRELSAAEKALLQNLSAETGITTAVALLQYMMAHWADKQNEIARLNRLLAYKQKKIEALRGENQ